MPKIEAQIVLDIAYRLFNTIYFEFDFESMRHILKSQNVLRDGCKGAADLLIMRDSKILLPLITDPGSPDKLDLEVVHSFFMACNPRRFWSTSRI